MPNDSDPFFSIDFKRNIFEYPWLLISVPERNISKLNHSLSHKNSSMMGISSIQLLFTIFFDKIRGVTGTHRHPAGTHIQKKGLDRPRERDLVLPLTRLTV